MRVTSASEQGNPSKDNEDWVTATPGLVVVLDGATARTDTGCVHGVSWFATKLGSAIVGLAGDAGLRLPEVLATAISHVAEMHPQCDLSHPGTPSAAVAIVRSMSGDVEYLVLGDTTVVLDVAGSNLQIVHDARVDSTAREARATADRYPIGSPEKQTALLEMKRGELAARNQPGGFWVATTDPTVTDHALTGTVSAGWVRRYAVLSDGAARIVNLFGALDWPGVLDLLAQCGPTELITRVRTIEASDPDGTRFPRNKRSDDATAVYATV